MKGGAVAAGAVDGSRQHWVDAADVAGVADVAAVAAVAGDGDTPGCRTDCTVSVSNVLVDVARADIRWQPVAPVGVVAAADVVPVLGNCWPAGLVLPRWL